MGPHTLIPSMDNPTVLPWDSASLGTPSSRPPILPDSTGLGRAPLYNMDRFNASGLAGIVQKPASIQELLAKIRQALEGAPAGDAPIQRPR